MSLLADQSKCTGCMACKQICPKNCINENEDEYGNIYPKIDEKSCINCMQCSSVCPEINNHNIHFNTVKNAYATWSLNENSRKTSASGGAASEFYSNAIKHNYWICGVEYTDDFKVIHTLTKDKNRIKKYKQSKYVFSDTNNIYIQIKKILDNNEKIMFISLPCKVAGLYSFLKKEYDNLITIDIVCHGTPPYKQLSQHISSLNLNKAYNKLSFRQDNEFIFKLSNDTHTVYSKIGRKDAYLAAFLSGINYRPSCYSCSYAIPNRISDITICDFWGIGSKTPFNHPYTGAISAVLINTKKGKNFFDKSSNNLFVEERPVSEAIIGNAQLNHPTLVHPKQNEFKQLYNLKGFENAVKITLKKEINNESKNLKKNKLRYYFKKFVGSIFPKYRSYK